MGTSEAATTMLLKKEFGEFSKNVLKMRIEIVMNYGSNIISLWRFGVECEGNWRRRKMAGDSGVLWRCCERTAGAGGWFQIPGRADAVFWWEYGVEGSWRAWYLCSALWSSLPGPIFNLFSLDRWRDLPLIYKKPISLTIRFSERSLHNLISLRKFDYY